MSKYSSFKTQQLLVEGWRTFMVEQQPIGQQPQQTAKPEQSQQLDVRKPVDIKNMIIAKAKGKAGSPGPDQTTKQNIEKNNKLLASARSVTQPLQAAQVILQLFGQLSPEDQAEAAKVAQQILATPVQKESVIREDLVISALEKLGGGDLSKGIQKIGTGAFIGSIAVGLAQIASGDLQGGAATALKTIANNMQKLYASNNIGDLSTILSSVADVAAPGKRDDSIYEGAHLDDGTLVCEACLEELLESQRTIIEEAKYQGRTVTLNKPMKGDVKKSKVYVKDPTTGNVKKVNFGDKKMKIKKNIPSRRKSFRARHNCENPGPKTKARYWSCKAW